MPVEKDRDYTLQPPTIETVDRAMLNWLDESMNVSCATGEGWEKVPVKWVAGERSHQVKNVKALRDSTGMLILPIITLERTSMAKDPAFKGTAWGNTYETNDYRGGAIQIAKRINQTKTADFANSYNARKSGPVRRSAGHGQINFRTKKENKRIVYSIKSIPMPVYMAMTYSIGVRTQYQQQMNEIMQPFMTFTGAINYFTIQSTDGHRFEAFMQQDFSQNNNVSDMGEDERKYETKFDIKVLGTLVGRGDNQDTPKISVRENIVEFKFLRERVALGDEKEEVNQKPRVPFDKKTDYRS